MTAGRQQGGGGRPAQQQPAFFRAVRSCGDDSASKVQIYTSCADFLAGADAEMGLVGKVVADLATDWALAAEQLEEDVASREREAPGLSQHALYLLGTLLSRTDVLGGCPEETQGRMIGAVLRCITSKDSAKVR